jgi:hypothetical protein
MPASKNHLLPKGDLQSRKRTRADAASESLALQLFKLQNERITRSNQLSSIQNVEDLLKNAARGSR